MPKRKIQELTADDVLDSTPEPAAAPHVAALANESGSGGSSLMELNDEVLLQILSLDLAGLC